MLKHQGTCLIETDRLILRPFQFSDADDMLTYWVSDPAIQSLYSEPVYTTKEAVNGLLDRYISGYNQSDYYRRAIQVKERGIYIGKLGVFLVNNDHHFC